MTHCKPMLSSIAAVSLMLALPAFSQEQAAEPSQAQQQGIQKMAEQVRKQIVTLPQYGVFDHIYFGIKNDAVTLYGKASRPTLKSSAENVVKKIEGVKGVDNQIEVLPVSPMDDRVRVAVYNSIYGFAPLQRYSSGRGRVVGGPSVARRAGGITNDPPIGWHAIHIIVQNGNVTLVGVVDNDSDAAMAEMRANIVPGVFSVTNDLSVARQTK
ncbi:MAG: BON domain-containing protein [Acidobacteriaceae bacterium]|nr:BON domain-containing protein [Acidobacteriaceae bacterium]MBV8570973.1 BON domain-containing protein [Acidobacteriaceae bacterium]